MTLCKFAPLTRTQLCEMLNAITGWDYEPRGLLEAGDRSIALKRSISLMLGLTREQDKIPKIYSSPLDEGSTAGMQPDMEKMLKGYSQSRGWDWATGRPSKDKLLELGLDQVAAQMDP